MSRDGERLIELVSELGSRMGNLLTDMVPPSAQVHLLNAQRELITALVIVYEHQAGTRRADLPARRAAAATRRRAAPRKPRSTRIPIE